MADIPEPISDNDRLLHNIIDGTPDISDLIPTSREEEYLKYIAINGAGSGGSGVGKDLSGQEVESISGTTVTAGNGSEIFNDYRDRTFNSSGVVETGNIASGEYSHSEGTNTTAIGDASHAEGQETISSHQATHAEGYKTKAITGMAHAEGYMTTASATAAHAEGYMTTASGSCSHAGGRSTTAKSYQTAIGKFSSILDGAGLNDQSGFAFIIGNGLSNSSLDVAFKVSFTGHTYADANHTTGGGFAEYFEWKGGNPYNEDRRGLFVTLEWDKIVLADEYSEYILGIITGTPTIVGNSADNRWDKMYLKDVFGQRIEEEIEEEITDSDGKTKLVKGKRFVINPEYDNTIEYISREERSEWAYVSLLGQEVAVDDGTCVVNGYCAPTIGGKATKSSKGYRVIKRIDSNHIKIIIQ